MTDLVGTQPARPDLDSTAVPWPQPDWPQRDSSCRASTAVTRLIATDQTAPHNDRRTPRFHTRTCPT